MSVELGSRGSGELRRLSEGRGERRGEPRVASLRVLTEGCAVCQEQELCLRLGGLGRSRVEKTPVPFTLQHTTLPGPCSSTPRADRRQKNAPGWKTKCILGVPGLKLLRGSMHTPEGLCRTALLPLPEPSLSSARGGCVGTGWQNLQNKAFLVPGAVTRVPHCSTWHCHRAGQGSTTRALPGPGICSARPLTHWAMKERGAEHCIPWGSRN